MNIIWDSNVQGICYEGCIGLYCNPLHFGIIAGCVVLAAVAVFWMYWISDVP
jgi:hypothetical protein